MPTLSITIENDRILVIAQIAIVRTPGQYGPPALFPALVDTGATFTAITQDVMEILHPNPVGPSSFTTADGAQHETEKYMMRVDIPINQPVAQPDGTIMPAVHVVGAELTVTRLPDQPPDHAVVLGLDFLTRFHITMWDGLFILSN